MYLILWLAPHHLHWPTAGAWHNTQIDVYNWARWNFTSSSMPTTLFRTLNLFSQQQRRRRSRLRCRWQVEKTFPRLVPSWLERASNFSGERLREASCRKFRRRRSNYKRANVIGWRRIKKTFYKVNLDYFTTGSRPFRETARTPNLPDFSLQHAALKYLPCFEEKLNLLFK